MARSACFLRLASFLSLLLAAATASAVQRSEALLPATTKGYISTDDVDEVRTKFNETDLGALVADPAMKPFIEDFKKQIGAKLEKAGKKLGLKWADMEGVYAGEVALALIQPDPKNKMSHAQVLLVDITGKRQQADAMLAKVDANQKAQGAVKTKHAVGGVEMFMYTQKLKEGEKDPERNFYFIHEEQLVASDHYQTALEIANRMNGKAETPTLDSVEAFKYSMQRNEEAVRAGDGHHHVRWFVEPFGYVEASRAAEGGRRKRGTDYLKILQGQGFPAIQGLGGYVIFSTGDEEILHRTYVYAPAVKRQPGDKNTDKYDLAMRMLDFPNSPDAKHLDPQPWVLNDVASYLTFNWRMKEAFGHSETLVDAIAGDKGVFDEIWLSMKTDPNGPKIDIYGELINHLGERATLLTDVTVPVTIKSERLLVLVEVKRPDIVAKALEKAFKEDPAAKKRVFRGQTIWEITQEEATTAGPELMIEGAGFVSTEDATAAEEDETAAVLPNMALSVMKGHLVVSTHVEYIEDFITRADDPNNLAKTRDFQRVHEALVRLGSDKDSFRYYTRTEEAYRATYELIQQNKLPEAETLLARMLNAMLSEQEGEVRKREIDGSKLPPYKDVMKYFGPGGLFVQSEDNGWWAVGCLLKRLPPDAAAPPVKPATAASGSEGGAAVETTPVKTPAADSDEPAAEVAGKPKE